MVHVGVTVEVLTAEGVVDDGLGVELGVGQVGRGFVTQVPPPQLTFISTLFTLL